MKPMTVCVSLLSVSFAICEAHDNPVAAKENRRSVQCRICVPVCPIVCTQSQPAVVMAKASPVPVEDAELRAKLIERRDTLRELVQIHAARVDGAEETPSMLNQAYIEVLEAELPLAKTCAERIVLYEKLLEARSEIERVTQVMREAGCGRPDDHLRAKVDRIKAEIDLHHARKMK